MTTRTRVGVVLLALAQGLSGCGGSGSSPTPLAPSPVSQQGVPPQATPLPGFFYGGGYTLKGVTLFGVVSEATPTGQAPIADVSVYCDACGAFGHTWTKTDANGYYSFSGDLDSGGGVWLSGTPTPLKVEKEGYQDPPGLPSSARLPSGPGWREVLINGDTRLDIQLVRR